MDQYHEPPNELSMQTRDMTRALISLKEEIEAIDWYNQRIEVCKDEKLRAILEHNRNEEIEHACMALEWLRQNMPGWDEQMKSYLFAEQAGQEKEQAVEQDQGDLGLSGMKK
jgi:ferritin-like protein